jgi:hypothetical protein
VFADDVRMLSDNIGTVKKSTKALLLAESLHKDS